jgi:hypothetical protein
MSWMPRSAGDKALSISVTDGRFIVFQNFTLMVANVPPRITNRTVPDAWVGTPFIYNVSAEDANLDTLVFSMSQSPEGMTVDSITGAISWAPKQAGSFPVAMSVSDGIDATTFVFNITVKQAPKFTSSPVTAAYVDGLYIYNAMAIGAADAILNYSLVSGPPGMAINSSNGKLIWTPTTTGSYAVSLNVTDGKGGEAKQEFTINVSAALKPEVTITSPQSGGTWKGKVSIAGTVKKGSREVVIVQLQIDSKGWNNVTGIYSWSYQLDTRSLGNGKHSLQLRAYDGKDYSPTLARDVKVNNEPSAKTPMMDGELSLALFIGTTILLMTRRRRESI